MQQTWRLSLSRLLLVIVAAFASVKAADEQADNETSPSRSFVLLFLPVYFCEKSSDCTAGHLKDSNLTCDLDRRYCTCRSGDIWNDLKSTCQETIRCFTDFECPVSYHCSHMECVPNAGPASTGFWYFVFAIPLLIICCYCVKCFCCRDAVPPAPESRDCSPDPAAPVRPPRRSETGNMNMPQAYHGPCPDNNSQLNNTPPPPYEVAINLPKVLLPDPENQV